MFPVVTGHHRRPATRGPLVAKKEAKPEPVGKHQRDRAEEIKQLAEASGLRVPPETMALLAKLDAMPVAGREGKRGRRAKARGVLSLDPNFRINRYVYLILNRLASLYQMDAGKVADVLLVDRLLALYDHVTPTAARLRGEEAFLSDCKAVLGIDQLEGFVNWRIGATSRMHYFLDRVPVAVPKDQMELVPLRLPASDGQYDLSRSLVNLANDDGGQPAARKAKRPGGG